MTTVKPFSQACENNKAPILEVLQQALADCSEVLEIGSGTGQHAACFAPQLSHLQWYTSDRLENHAGVNLWIDETLGNMDIDNLHRPKLLDVDMEEWPVTGVDGVFTANTCHIMPWSSVENMFSGVGRILAPGGKFCIYGPFNYNGNYTSDSNARFDIWLKDQQPHQAIRDFEAIETLARRAGMTLVEDCEMPANNRLLVWCKERM